MLAIILLSILVPTLTGIAFLTLRNRNTEFLADVRGVALQTVIIIVVLLAIAGAVAGVLASRGSDTVASLQGQVGTHLTDALHDTPVECENAGFVWDADGPDDTANNADDGCYSF